MKVKTLMRLLGRFDPEAHLYVGVNGNAEVPSTFSTAVVDLDSDGDPPVYDAEIDEIEWKNDSYADDEHVNKAARKHNAVLLS